MPLLATGKISRKRKNGRVKWKMSSWVCRQRSIRCRAVLVTNKQKSNDFWANHNKKKVEKRALHIHIAITTMTKKMQKIALYVTDFFFFVWSLCLSVSNSNAYLLCPCGSPSGVAFVLTFCYYYIAIYVCLFLRLQRQPVYLKRSWHICGIRKTFVVAPFAVPLLLFFTRLVKWNNQIKKFQLRKIKIFIKF